MFGLELVEGKDEPPERVNLKDNDNLGKTVGLLLRLTKSLYYTNKVVVLDSGFCVLKALVELRKKFVFAAAVIKKRRYWPKYVDGDTIKKYFDDK
jgi:Transposase IS4